VRCASVQRRRRAERVRVEGEKDGQEGPQGGCGMLACEAVTRPKQSRRVLMYSAGGRTL
jgi:hypothetical protein